MGRKQRDPIGPPRWKKYRLSGLIESYIANCDRYNREMDLMASDDLWVPPSERRARNAEWPALRTSSQLLGIGLRVVGPVRHGGRAWRLGADGRARDEPGGAELPDAAGVWVEIVSPIDGRARRCEGEGGTP